MSDSIFNTLLRKIKHLERSIENHHFRTVFVIKIFGNIQTISILHHDIRKDCIHDILSEITDGIITILKFSNHFESNFIPRDEIG